MPSTAEKTSYVVWSSVKEASSLRVSEDFKHELNEKIEQLIFTAEKRAKQNGRQTLMPYDL